MNQNLILWPFIIQALVTLFLYVPMGRARTKAVKTGQASTHDFKLPKRSEPPEIAKFGNAVTNQFELPTLFFVVALAAHGAALIDLPMLVLAWTFVLIKTAHAFVHITTNRIKYRFWLFSAALIIALLMWLWFAIQLALA